MVQFESERGTGLKLGGESIQVGGIEVWPLEPVFSIMHQPFPSVLHTELMFYPRRLPVPCLKKFPMPSATFLGSFKSFELIRYLPQSASFGKE